MILVEGTSDKIALDAVGTLVDRGLSEEGAVVVPIGGAMDIGHFLELLSGRATHLQLVGLVDAGEAHAFSRALRRGGLITESEQLEAAGFFVCVDDLEDELIRALGPEHAAEIIEENGDGKPFHTFQNQPQWRGRPATRQIRRWLGAGSGRKHRYAKHFVQALDVDELPKPLARLSDRIGPR